MMGLLIFLIFGQTVMAEGDIFTRDHAALKQSFFAAIEHVEKKYKVERYEFTFSAPTMNGELLHKVDWVKIKSDNTNKKVMVIISGVHGVEGYVGGAVQTYLALNQVDSILNSYDLILIHGLNPFGIQKFRRVSESNVDLNRAFVLNRDAFIDQNKSYTELDNFLNPKEPVRSLTWHKPIFFFQSIFNVLKYSMESLRRSILSGQYLFEKGLFYGGKFAPPQQELISKIIKEEVSQYESAFFVDLHTGYGEKGHLHLLAGLKNDPMSEKLARVFPDGKVNYSDEKKYYPTYGDLLTFMAKNAEKQGVSEVLAITFEYGTLDSQKLLGAFESIRRMVLENQNHWYPTNNEDIKKTINKDFFEMFNPPDPIWQKQILDQTKVAIEYILKRN